MPGRMARQRDAEERGQRPRAEALRRLLDAPVEPGEARADQPHRPRDHDEDVAGHERGDRAQDREPRGDRGLHVEDVERGAEHDAGHHERQQEQVPERLPPAEPVARQAQRRRHAPAQADEHGRHRDLQAQPEPVHEARALRDREEPLEAVALGRKRRDRLTEEGEPHHEHQRQQDQAERCRGGGVQGEASERATVHLGPCLTPCPPALLPRSARPHPPAPSRSRPHIQVLNCSICRISRPDPGAPRPAVGPRGLWYTSRACPRWHRSIPPSAPGSNGDSPWARPSPRRRAGPPSPPATTP